MHEFLQLYCQYAKWDLQQGVNGKTKTVQGLNLAQFFHSISNYGISRTFLRFISR